MRPPEETAGGPLGKLAGKVKEVAGEATGNDDLAREGRMQQASSEAEAQARQEAAEARQREAEAELEQQAREAEARANAVDPEGR